MATTYDQPTAQPSRKVTAAAAAAAAVTVLAWLTSLLGLDIPAEVQGALTVLFVALAGYSVRDSVPDDGHGEGP